VNAATSPGPNRLLGPVIALSSLGAANNLYTQIGLMLLIALGIALATYKFDRRGFENQFVMTWSAVMLLLLGVMVLGLIDVRLTWKLRRTLRDRKRSS